MPYLPAYFRAYFLWSLYGHILKYAAKYAEKTTRKTLEIMGLREHRFLSKRECTVENTDTRGLLTQEDISK